MLGVVVVLALVAGVLTWHHDAPAPPAAVESWQRWRETAPGIQVRRIAWEGAGRPVRVALVKADPARCTVRVVDAHSGKGKTAGDSADAVCPEHGAAINASYFCAANDLTPIGLLIADGKQISTYHATGSWGLFMMRGGKPQLILADPHYPDDIEQAVQCKPRLVIDGEIPTFKPQGGAMRSAVGIDSEGWVILAASEGRLTLEEWAACLRAGAGCRHALNLDGGPSTQLTVRGQYPLVIPGGWPVPNFLVVAPRS